MERNFKEEIALRDKVIDGLEREGKLKDELIAAQKEIIEVHEEHIKKLTNMMKQIFKM